MAFPTRTIRRALLPAALLCLTMGCGDRSEDPNTVTLRVAVWKANNPRAWSQALDRFHQTHPNIRVVLEVGPNSSTQLHDLITQKLRNRDSSLDAFLMDVVWPAEFAAAGWTLPLDDRFARAERTHFFPGCVAAVTCDGQIHGVPFNTDGGLLFCRSDLLTKHGLEPPKTWPELVEQATLIRAREGNSHLHGYSGQFRQYEGLVCNMLEFVHSHGGNLSRCASPEATDAVRFVRESVIGGIAPRGVLTYGEQESLDLFKSGGAVFHRNWPYAWTLLNDGAQSRVAGRVVIAVLPAFPGFSPAAALGGWSFGIHTQSRHPDEAWAFIRFMTGLEMQRHFAVAAGKAPARRALYGDDEVLEANPHFADLAAVFETATPRPRSPIYPRISHILQRYFHEALASPDANIVQLARGAERRIRDEQSSIAETE